MKNNYKQLIATILLLCIIVSSVACGSTIDETTVSNRVETTEQITNDATTEPSGDTENVDPSEQTTTAQTAEAPYDTESNDVSNTTTETEATDTTAITETTNTSEITTVATEEDTTTAPVEIVKEYSKDSNSGVRDEVCTSLKGTSAENYYVDQYSYDSLITLSEDELKAALNLLMTSTHSYKSTYADCKESYTITDCEENNTALFLTLYTSYAARYDEFNSGNGWNREHVWPKSLGGFDNSGAGSDLHHIRPTENRTNSVRGNLKYGYATNGSATNGNLSGLLGGYKGTYYEPVDNVKGDVARIILYVHVRYYNVYSKCANIENVFESIDVLLEWCALDPVDTWEMGRNEVVENIQGNRNVFIDYPELAWTLFGREIPDNLVTPSSN